MYYLYSVINSSFILKISVLIVFCVGISIPATAKAHDGFEIKRAPFYKTTTQDIPISEEAIEEAFYTPHQFFTPNLSFVKVIYPCPIKTVEVLFKFKKSNILISHRFLTYRNMRI